MSIISRLFVYGALLVYICAFLARASPIDTSVLDTDSPEDDLTLHAGNVTKRATRGPVINANFPDPSIFHSTNGRGARQGWWYAFATRNIGSSIHIQVAQSPDFNSWSVLQNYDALPNLPNWVYKPSSNVWAPDVMQMDNGQYVMYFSASTAQDPNRHCIGVATSSNVIGPYVAQPNPLICPLAQGGAIDASGFRDQDGTMYLTWKVDGNGLGHGGACGNNVAPYVGTPIMIQQLTSNGLSFTGPLTQILNNNGASDMGIVEAPSLVKIPNGAYFLFFSSGCYLTGGYTISYATAPSPRGPFTRRGVLLGTGSRGLSAPGGADVSFDQQHVLFHADIGNGRRGMYTADISLRGTQVFI